MGVLGGVLGAFFINVNTYVNKLRKQYIVKPWVKVFECAFFCMATTSLFYWATYNFGSCVKREMDVNEEEQEYYSFWCENGHYDPLSTIFFASEGEVIRNIMSSNVETTLT